MNIFKIIHFKLWNFFYYKSPVYIEFNIFNPFKYWFKARHIFYKPHIKKYKLSINEHINGDYMYIPYETYNKWFHLSFKSCQYKIKLDEYRFENNPYICLIWRNKVKYIWGFEAPLYEITQIYTDKQSISKNNMLYWEGILTYLYENNKDIIETYKNNIWTMTLDLKDIDEHTQKNKKYKILYTLLPCIKPKYADKIMKNINNVDK